MNGSWYFYYCTKMLHQIARRMYDGNLRKRYSNEEWICAKNTAKFFWNVFSKRRRAKRSLHQLLIRMNLSNIWIAGKKSCSNFSYFTLKCQAIRGNVTIKAAIKLNWKRMKTRRGPICEKKSFFWLE